MRKFSIKIQKEFCEECSLALRRFLNKMPGINTVDTADDKIIIDYDPSKILEKDIFRITKESIEKLGYKIIE